MAINQDTLVNIAIIIVFAFLVFNLTKKVTQIALSFVATIFLVFFLFIWTPDEMVSYLRLDTILKPMHVELLQSGYSKIVDFREVLLEKTGVKNKVEEPISKKGTER